MVGSLSLIQINLWQTGVRALFRFYQAKAGLTQDEAWSGLREELIICVSKWNPPAVEWEFQLVQAILVGEHDCTLEEAHAMDERSPDATPIIDALKACIGRAPRQS
jgi:hypothetical protein